MSYQHHPRRTYTAEDWWADWERRQAPLPQIVAGIAEMRSLLQKRCIGAMSDKMVQVLRPEGGIILEIPRVPPSPNLVLRGHWRSRQRTHKLWRDEVFYALRHSGFRDVNPYPKARVEIDRRSRGELDPDNLVASMKPVIDALRYSNVIENDTPKHIELIVTQCRDAKLPPRTRIFVHPM